MELIGKYFSLNGIFGALNGAKRESKGIVAEFYGRVRDGSLARRAGESVLIPFCPSTSAFTWHNLPKSELRNPSEGKSLAAL
jgi:hypothetical protein